MISAAAINVSTGDVAGLLTRQKGYQGSYFFRLPKSFHSMVIDHGFKDLGGTERIITVSMA